MFLILYCHNQFPITYLDFDIYYIISNRNSLYEATDSSLHINCTESWRLEGNEKPVAIFMEWKGHLNYN